MLTWRDLGLGRGLQGKEYVPRELRCPYCSAQGRFNRVFRGEAREIEGGGPLYSDIWQCLACANFVYIIWRNETGNVDYRAFPAVHAHAAAHHPSWPEDAEHAYADALAALLTEDWDGAMVMGRRAIAAVTAACGAPAGTLAEEVQSVRDKGLIPNALADWAAAMPQLRASSMPATAHHARETVRFARHLLDVVYTLPHDAERYRYPAPAS